jgi:hypothetical protein
VKGFAYDTFVSRPVCSRQLQALHSERPSTLSAATFVVVFKPLLTYTAYKATSFLPCPVNIEEARTESYPSGSGG